VAMEWESKNLMKKNLLEYLFLIVYTVLFGTVNHEINVIKNIPVTNGKD
jgi:hypothetical protein